MRFLYAVLFAACAGAGTPICAQGTDAVRTLTGHTGNVSCVAVTPDGQTLVSGSSDSTLRVWRMADGTLLHTLTGHADWVPDVAVTPDSHATVSASYDGTIKVWRISDGTLLRTITVGSAGVRCVAISPDGRTIVAGITDKTIRLYDIADGAPIRTLTSPFNYAGDVVFSPDGQTIVSGHRDGGIAVWRMSDGTLLRSWAGHGDYAKSIAFLPDGETIVSGGWDAEIRVWRLSDGALMQALLVGAKVQAVVLTPDGRTAVCALQNGGPILSVIVSRIQLWSVSGGVLLRAYDNQPGAMLSAALSPDNRTIVSGGTEGLIKLWHMGNVVPDTISTTTWTNAGNPYLVGGSVVPAGETLTIEPGVDVLVGLGGQLLVEGVLRAVGTQTDSIRFMPSMPIPDYRNSKGLLSFGGGDSSTISYARISGGRVGTWDWDRNVWGQAGGVLVSGTGTRLGLSHAQITGNQARDEGGGIAVLAGASVLATECGFSQNTVLGRSMLEGSRDGSGGAILISGNGSSLTLENSHIVGNSAMRRGGGIAVKDSASVDLIGCTISSNNTVGEWGDMDDFYAGMGAGVHAEEGSRFSARSCLFEGNWGGGRLGSIGGRGGGIYLANSWGNLSDCGVRGNKGESGGGIHSDHSVLKLERCSLVGNSANQMRKGSPIPWFTGGDGGGIYLAWSEASLDNCTITANSVAGKVYPSTWMDSPVFHGGGICARGGNLAVRNSILWGNVANTDGVNSIAAYDAAVTVAYSNVQGDSVWAGEGNISADPLFLAAGTDSMRLHSTSPCRDTGDPASPLDPDGSRADMGARPFDPTLTVESPHVPLCFLVMQNFPNPFNPSTTLRFSLPEAGHVTLAVYDIRGARVRTLVDGPLTAGAHSVVWDGKDAIGRNVASGVYVYRLTAAQGVVTRRMVLLR